MAISNSMDRLCSPRRVQVYSLVIQEIFLLKNLQLSNGSSACYQADFSGESTINLRNQKAYVESLRMLAGIYHMCQYYRPH
jgi:hypothetical protein